MKKLEHELDLLRQRVATMGDVAESMVDLAVQTLADPQDRPLYEKVLGDEDRLDQMQLEIDAEAIRLLTVYGPVAANLRLVLTVSRINSELERIGDQTVSMCHHIQLLASTDDVAPLPQFHAMAKLVRAMLHDALKAFRLDDSRKAKSTMGSDDLVDTLNDQIIRELLGGRAHGSSESSGAEELLAPLAQILIAQSLERIGDQACNVCEQIVYMVEGADIRHRGKPL